MIPAWLHSLSIAVLLLGLVCAVVIAADLVRHKQHMWIMNVVWVTALFGTVWIKLEVDTIEFWFIMQIAMICGFLTAYPANGG